MPFSQITEDSLMPWDIGMLPAFHSSFKYITTASPCQAFLQKNLFYVCYMRVPISSRNLDMIFFSRRDMYD